MSPFDWGALAILLVSGCAAGMVNTIVGSGSLITFPVLVALGCPPVLANVTNNIGVLPGSISGAIAYREQLRGQFRKLLPLALFSLGGGLVGAILLLVLPAEAFDSVVPILILAACVLVIASPRLKSMAIAKAESGRNDIRKPLGGLFASAGLTGVYGGYFGAAQGVILLSLLSMQLKDGIQTANAYKNVLAAAANSAAAVVFVSTTEVAWSAAGAIAVGAVIGGQLGGIVGKRLPAVIFRTLIVFVGITAILYFYMK